jgi:hypothetical protein
LRLVFFTLNNQNNEAQMGRLRGRMHIDYWWERQKERTTRKTKTDWQIILRWNHSDLAVQGGAISSECDKKYSGSTKC